MRTTCLSRKWLAVLATSRKLPSGAHSSALSDFHRVLFDGRGPPLPRARTDDRSTLADRLAYGRSSGARRCRSLVPWPGDRPKHGGPKGPKHTNLGSTGGGGGGGGPGRVLQGAVHARGGGHGPRPKPELREQPVLHHVRRDAELRGRLLEALRECSTRPANT